MDTNVFDFDEPKAQLFASKNNELADHVVEALQIVRISKGVMGVSRTILDTIKVEGAKMTYERAKRIALFKADKLGNCMVIEKIERVIKNF